MKTAAYTVKSKVPNTTIIRLSNVASGMAWIQSALTVSPDEPMIEPCLLSTPTVLPIVYRALRH
jgi:hypothetical protein